jgi:hypothetical protein
MIQKYKAADISIRHLSRVCLNLGKARAGGIEAEGMRFSSTSATLARRNQTKKKKAIRQPRNELKEM